MGRRRKVLHILCGIIIGMCLYVTVRNLNQHSSDMCKPTADTVRRKLGDPQALIEENIEEELVFVGVMTAEQYLETRAKAVYDTWGKTVPGRIVFFSSEYSHTNSVPLIALKGVDDSYPPQKKSFFMLKYMHDHFIDKFEWFIRADDDVYMRTDRLEKLLRSVDSRKPWFIGQTGRGNSEEFGLLSLESDENFCMGGPGVIFSRETLRRIAPYIEECLMNLYTMHEDVEVGRCVRRFAGISCTWSYEAGHNFKMQVILYHNQSGSAAFTGDLKQKEVHRAITLHPVKQPQYMQRLHKYVKLKPTNIDSLEQLLLHKVRNEIYEQGLTVQSLKQESIFLHRDIANCMESLGVGLEKLSSAELVRNVPLFENPQGSKNYLGDPSLLGVSPSLNRFRVNKLGDVMDWEFINRTLFSYKDTNPKRRVPSTMTEGFNDILKEAMDIINQYSKQRGRVIDFKDVFYAYVRLDPLNGVDLILDLLLVYRKYRGHKMTVTVRRHAYVQQTFTGTEIREIDVNNAFSEEDPAEDNLFLHQKIIKQISHISKHFQLPAIFDADQNRTHKKTINFILPLSGRPNTFKRFLNFYERVCLKENELTRLIVVLYRTSQMEFEEMLTVINNLRDNYKFSDIRTIVMEESFARGRALQFGAEILQNDDLMFFIDVDMAFNSRTLLRIRQNAIKNTTIYFPIVYSLYDPKTFHKSYDVIDNTIFDKELLLNEENGSWRQFGFGIVSLYKSDFIKLGGFNTSIKAWGMEDVAFYDNVIKTDLQLVRSVDPGLVHIYHPAACVGDNSDILQQRMCFGSQASTFGSLKDLQKYYLQMKHTRR